MACTNIDITTCAEPNHHLVTLRGMLDASSEDTLSKALDALCQSGPPHILLDCTELSYVNSASFGLLFHCHRQCESRGGHLIICGLSPKIESILKLLGLHQVLNVRSSVEEALNDLPAMSTPG